MKIHEAVIFALISPGINVYDRSVSSFRDPEESILSALWLDITAGGNVDKELVLSAAQIKATHPVSYADTFVAALAKHLDTRIVTGDPEFQAPGVNWRCLLATSIVKRGGSSGRGERPISQVL